MLGNEAVAQGAYEAGAAVASSYPGTPSTEITEALARYTGIYSEWAPNEKVAVETAIGASVAGGRAFSAMKHVGLNVAADPLFTVSYTGVNAGLVICVADDQGMHSSQNEQDSRHYARAAKVPMLEPSDSEECRVFTKKAYELSEEYDTPVLLRLSTRVSHSRSLVSGGGAERTAVAIKPYVKNPGKYVMMPAMARGRHVFVEERTRRLRGYSELNTVTYSEDRKIGIISSGIAYQYAREALGDGASYLKLGMVWPLPDDLLREFAANVEECVVIEELDPFIEEHCKSLGIPVKGKDMFSPLGEYSANAIEKALLGGRDAALSARPPGTHTQAAMPSRPPVLCPGCPHKGVFYAIKRLGLAVCGDIGCYTLGALPPIQAMDTCVCMGASIGMAHGMGKVRKDLKTVAVIGDSTFLHSGVTGLINVTYNKGAATVIILDNSITGMTGHQQNPATGTTLMGEKVPPVDLQKLCEAIGVRRVFVADPFDPDAMTKAIKRETEAADEPSVIIARRPCALLPVFKPSKGQRITDKCKGCGMCLKIGCPAISKTGGQNGVDLMAIDPQICVGCGFCQKVCKFGAISAL
ncbi:MAG: indolepyruvate ferredoxin oxidoreductase subunit alpha [Clostridiales bacterium]|jgi:indolepyruvate ferredoxin oxidoreductase alpha subunit|nr:indolepyruvate ferredoxin oxidoreductase subunit alpha [Clostridiales bacterium]